jgi:hypothetical protein
VHAEGDAPWRLLEERRLDPNRPSHRGYRRTSDFRVSATDPDASPMWDWGAIRLGYHATEAYKKAIRKRQVWVEPLFAEAKEWHGLRRLRLRGLMNANIQGLLIAAGQNLKRFLAASGWGRRHAPCGSLLVLPREPERLTAVYGW